VLLLGLVAYVPQQLRFMGRRAMYYYSGAEADPVRVLESMAAKGVGSVFDSADL
jgi:hypothetical protein